MNDSFKQRLQDLNSRFSLAFDLLRAYLGIALFIKAIYILGHREFFVDLIGKSDNALFATGAALHFVIPIHLFGGLLLAIGLLTRIAAGVQIPVVLGAVMVSAQSQELAFDPRQSFELSMLVLFLLALILVFGPGCWSVDRYLETNKKKSGKGKTKAAATAKA